MLREPENSWEVSYIMAKQYPGIDTKISYEQLCQVLSRVRRAELDAWLTVEFPKDWLKEHTLA